MPIRDRDKAARPRKPSDREPEGDQCDADPDGDGLSNLAVTGALPEVVEAAEPPAVLGFLEPVSSTRRVCL